MSNSMFSTSAPLSSMPKTQTPSEIRQQVLDECEKLSEEEQEKVAEVARNLLAQVNSAGSLGVLAFTYIAAEISIQQMMSLGSSEVQQ